MHITHDTKEPSLLPHDSPLQSVHSQCDKGSMQQNELTNLVTKLTDRVAVLENDLQQTKKLYSSAITKLILRVKKLEKQVKTTKDRKRARLVVSEDEDAPEDSSKQGRKISEIDEDPTISLVQDKGMTWLVEDRGSGEKGEAEVSTINVPISNASATLEVSTAAANLVYVRRCAEKRKDKGKATIREDEYFQKKSKRQLEQERLEEIDIAEKKEDVAEVDHAHVIDWNDPSVIRYHALQNRPRSVAEVRKNMCIYLKNQGGYKMSDFKGMSYNDIRPIFEKVWDQIHYFVPMDSELEVQRLKRASQEVKIKPAKNQKRAGQESSVSVEEPKEKEPVDPSQEEIQELMIIVPEKGMHVEALQTKYPIISWEVYSEDTMQFWKIIRVGNHTEVYQVFEDMLKIFDKDDLVKLWSLVQERFNSPGLTEDKDKELWVELKMLFEPDKKDLLELQKFMHDPLKWWLYDTCSVHHVTTK
ncbi:hypothetical protein Tco_0337498 [Tanacetum coccineum]